MNSYYDSSMHMSQGNYKDSQSRSNSIMHMLHVMSHAKYYMPMLSNMCVTCKTQWYPIT